MSAAVTDVAKILYMYTVSQKKTSPFLYV